jgi:hypothetical protein
MNIASLRTVLKAKWLTYYRDNRNWITRLRVWGTHEEKRRPSSSFILGALSAQEPELMELLPLIVDLNNNPDRIVAALGLDFNPEDEMDAFERLSKTATPLPKQALKMLSNPNQQPINLVRQPEPLRESIREPISQPESQPASRSMRQPIDPPASQPNSLPDSLPVGQSSYQPASQLTHQPGHPSGNTRIPLDTAQLKIHEQPNRDAGNPASSNEHSRDADL